MNADELIQQITTWLEEADERFDIEALLDLPELDWVTIHRMSCRGDLINLSYRGRSMIAHLSKTPVELICERASVKAVRRVERMNFEDF